MFRNLVLLTLCLLFDIFSFQKIDQTICPNGLTTSPSDPQWPRTFPDRFEILAEVTTEIEAFEVTQLFIGPHRDVTYFHDYNGNLNTFYDYELNEMLVFDDYLKCDRLEIRPDEYSPFVTGQILKPSVLLGFDGRNKYNNTFYTRYIGKETIRGGISTLKFQSCFFINQENVTINATYYIAESPPNQLIPTTQPEFIQIDVQTNSFAYTYNIIRYTSHPSLTITTPSGIFCPNRTNTKPFPQNLPSRLFLHAEVYTPKDNDKRSRLESYNHLIDENLEFERVDYTMGKITTVPTPSGLLVDYLTNLNYLYTRETQQCTVTNVSAHSIGTTNEILFQFGDTSDSTQFHYSGLTGCGREHMQCHRWIGQRDIKPFIQQFEWYWSATYNEIDLQELIPIRLNIMTIFKSDPAKITSQETSIFNYNSRPNSMELIDSTLGECYRALGPNRGFNYAILRLTLNNDAKHPVHKYLLSLQNRLHMQLANDLKIRHIRLSSFVIDTTRDTIDHQDTNVHVTFTLLDNPPISANILQEPSSLDLIRQLARQINDGKFRIRDNDGAYDLQARPNSLRTLVLYLLPSENYTSDFNETIFVYHNVSQIVYKESQKIVRKHTGPLIAALWTGFTLLGLVITLAISTFVAIRKWTPTLDHSKT